MTNPQAHIRKATLDDVAAIAALTDAAYAKFIPRIGRKPLPMLADYAKLVAENPVWLLTQDEQAIGVIVLIHEPEQMLIYSVAIHPDHQKQGLGRRLLAWAETQALEHGYSSVRLYTNARFEENIQLYTQIGYVETGREPMSNGSTVVYMVKPLAATGVIGDAG